MPPDPMAIDCELCGRTGTFTAGADGAPPAVVHVEGDNVRYCQVAYATTGQR